MADEQIKIRIQADADQFKTVSAAVEKALADIGRQAEITQGKIKSAGDAVKKSNQAWTSLALVVQDLPYGFRGIQNNLPALAGSLAAVTGPAYLAFSALISAVTIFDQSLQKANKTASDSMSKFYDVNVEIRSMASIFQSVRQGTLDARDATRMYNEKLGDLFGTAKNVYEAEKLYVSKTEGYVKAQYFRTKADIEYEKAKQALAKKDNAYAEDQVGVLGRLATATASFFKAGALQGVSGLYKQSVSMATDLANQQVELAGYVTDREEAEFQKRLALGDRYQSQAFEIEKQYGIKSTTFKDDLDKDLERRRREAEAARLKELERMAAAEKYLADWQIKLNTDIAEAQRKEGDRLKKLREEERNQEIQDYTQRVNLFKTFYANKLQLATGDRQAQKAILEEQMADLVYFFETLGMYSGDVSDIFSDIYKKWVDNNKAIADEAMKSIMNMGIGIINALGPSLDMLLEKGASIGEVISRAIGDLIKKFIKLAIAAAAAVAIIAILNPAILKNAGGALKFFGNLVGQGMGLGANLFGSGAGAVATNTAQGVSNDLIAANNTSASGGRFTLRGQDLLLSMNRSEKSLNLRRG
jgi:hypothetical protein